jgi:hypothetical protein
LVFEGFQHLLVTSVGLFISTITARNGINGILNSKWVLGEFSGKYSLSCFPDIRILCFGLATLYVRLWRRKMRLWRRKTRLLRRNNLLYIYIDVLIDVSFFLLSVSVDFRKISHCFFPLHIGQFFEIRLCLWYPQSILSDILCKINLTITFSSQRKSSKWLQKFCSKTYFILFNFPFSTEVTLHHFVLAFFIPFYNNILTLFPSVNFRIFENKLCPGLTQILSNFNIILFSSSPLNETLHLFLHEKLSAFLNNSAIYTSSKSLCYPLSLISLDKVLSKANYSSPFRMFFNLKFHLLFFSHKVSIMGGKNNNKTPNKPVKSPPKVPAQLPANLPSSSANSAGEHWHDVGVNRAHSPALSSCSKSSSNSHKRQIHSPDDHSNNVIKHPKTDGKQLISISYHFCSFLNNLFVLLGNDNHVISRLGDLSVNEMEERLLAEDYDEEPSGLMVNKHEFDLLLESNRRQELELQRLQRELQESRNLPERSHLTHGGLRVDMNSTIVSPPLPLMDYQAPPPPSSPVPEDANDEEVTDDAAQVLIIVPQSYPNDVATDECKRVIEDFITSVMVKFRGEDSIASAQIKTCKQGAIFIQCDSVREAETFMALFTSVNWTSRGLPPMRIVTEGQITLASVLVLWSPARNMTFEEAAGYAHSRTGVDTSSWRLIKTFYRNNRPGASHMFAASTSFYRRIREGGELRFRVGIHLTTASINVQNGNSRGKFSSYLYSFFLTPLSILHFVNLNLSVLIFTNFLLLLFLFKRLHKLFKLKMKKRNRSCNAPFVRLVKPELNVKGRTPRCFPALFFAFAKYIWIKVLRCLLNLVLQSLISFILPLIFSKLLEFIKLSFSHFFHNYCQINKINKIHEFIFLCICLFSTIISFSFVVEFHLIERIFFTRASLVHLDSNKYLSQLLLHIPSLSFQSLRHLILVLCTGSVYCVKLLILALFTITAHDYWSRKFDQILWDFARSQNGNLGKLKIDYG